MMIPARRLRKSFRPVNVLQRKLRIDLDAQRCGRADVTAKLVSKLCPTGSGKS